MAVPPSTFTVVDQAEAGPPAVRVWSTLAKAYGANVFHVKAAAIYLTLAP